MKKIYLLSLLLTVTAFISFGQKEKKKAAAEVKKERHKHYTKESRKEREGEEAEKGENLYQNTLQLAKEQFERLVDPATKTVPSERLADAYEALRAKEE